MSSRASENAPITSRPSAPVLGAFREITRSSDAGNSLWDWEFISLLACEACGTCRACLEDIWDTAKLNGRGDDWQMTGNYWQLFARTQGETWITMGYHVLQSRPAVSPEMCSILALMCDKFVTGAGKRRVREKMTMLPQRDVTKPSALSPQFRNRRHHCQPSTPDTLCTPSTLWFPMCRVRTH
jgi:hypothetical protein